MKVGEESEESEAVRTEGGVCVRELRDEEGEAEV